MSGLVNNSVVAAYAFDIHNSPRLRDDDRSESDAKSNPALSQLNPLPYETQPPTKRTNPGENYQGPISRPIAKASQRKSPIVIFAIFIQTEKSFTQGSTGNSTNSPPNTQESEHGATISPNGIRNRLFRHTYVRTRETAGESAVHEREDG